ncbi:MAG TPA: glycosyltransferase family 9 protein [Magnetospirillum sp.]|nr:glycosyltransferase family 9 protein [Magnetospirillum sp.]
MNILFITATRIGDAVLSTGLLDHLRQRYPQARITVACGPAPAPLFAAIPGVVRVIPMVKQRRAGHWLRLWRQTVTTPWSLVVDLRGSATGWLVPTLRRKIIRSDWTPQHRLVHLAKLFGLGASPPLPRLYAGAQAAARAAQLIPAGRPVLAVGPTANWGGKQWPADRFAAVAHALTAATGPLAGAAIAVFGAQNERDAVAQFVAALAGRKVIDLAGSVDLPTAYGCLERCAFYLGNDSGLMHMAAAAGIPTLGLFGPSSEILYGPMGPWCRALRGPRSFEDICHAPDFDHRSQQSLMQDLEVATVIAAATDLWQSRQAARL